MSIKEKIICAIGGFTIGAGIGMCIRAVIRLGKTIEDSKEIMPELKLVEAKVDKLLVSQEKHEKELENFLERYGWNCQEEEES